MPGTDWKGLDYLEVENLIIGWTPDEPPPGWKGVALPNRRLDPEPEPTGVLEQPTTYAIVRLVYEASENGYDGDADPFRTGHLEAVAYTEPGAGVGGVNSVLDQLLALLGETDGERLCLRPDEAAPIPGGMRGVWWMEGVRIPFSGG